MLDLLSWASPARDAEVWLIQGRGEVSITVEPLLFAPSGFHYDVAGARQDGKLFPAPLEKIKGDYDSGIGVAHWFLILLFLVPWVGFLVWRWRRIRRPSSAD